MDANDSRRRRVREEAAEWWTELEGEESSRADRLRFVNWLSESALHVAEFLQVAAVHKSLRSFGGWSRIETLEQSADENVVEFPHAAISSEERVTAKLKSGRKVAVIGWLAAGFCAVALYFTISLLDIQDNLIETQRSERREVLLEDGTVVKLDPRSRLRIGYRADQRRVFLDEGRALFQVAKAADRPFVVYAKSAIVRAVGTAFAVDQDVDETVITVAEGSVAVQSTLRQGRRAGSSARSGDPLSPDSSPEDDRRERDSSSTSIRAGSGSGEIFMVADQQVTVQSSGTAEPVRDVDSSVELAWADGRLVFEDDSVAAVIAEFNRYNHVQIRVFDDALRSRPVSGVFSAFDPESFIEFIETVEEVRTVRDGDRRITILPDSSDSRPASEVQGVRPRE